ncbi:MAG: hypothetical protein IJU03_03940 [Thermoguttaceae bacterium]|nr:hypothetical protein [Thermoguttaceae bacterium]
MTFTRQNKSLWARMGDTGALALGGGRKLTLGLGFGEAGSLRDAAPRLRRSQLQQALRGLNSF